ncbi:UDP-glucose 4-epimerase [Desulfatibacillum alkenivorans DSM 16219]|jgi:UDP-glucose 4-epimerase|uniref:UDP-glucose 4-epimerase n=1 Tax=Desulfatibacillum alkenivorans DSM 16219 TaxID=1121393 RepID=A0A1M6TE95_9BACT|nr:NAD-dependent epimerase/dehydratase family protein [Desulfatibacillum alkenivorans]SHK55290.1 UDP-glucose 4-epimerase [Desulfatibacillum alkenivorans DSM 16219]
MGKTVAITGVNSYFASTLLPQLQADPDVEKIVGIDVTPWRGGFSKVEFHREDIRSQAVEDLFKDVDTVFHLAFVVSEIQDKKKTFDINIQGSKNVFQACVKNQVRKVVYTSSNTVYGAYKEIPLNVDEEQPVYRNKESYYNQSKVDVEAFALDFFKGHPDMVFTIIRAALLFGPHTNNMFTDVYKSKVTAMPLGSVAHIHYIHEDDLGEALHLAFTHDLPGIYNVGADDAVSSYWTFRKAGLKVVPLPLFMLKPIADAAFKLRMLPASSGWLVIASNTIFSSNAKFKNATGWKPKYTSRETFLSYLKANQKVKEEKLSQAWVGFLWKRNYLLKGAMGILKNSIRATSVPGIRKVMPWMDVQKNSFTYLPVNATMEAANEVMLPQVVHDYIDQADNLIIMTKCGCRSAQNCQHHTHEVGCLFMGDTTLEFPKGISRKATREEAHAHVEKAISAGLVPMAGKVRVDNDIFLVKDRQKLLSVCFCCHCCCMMTYFKHIPPEQLDHVMTPVEGLSMTITDDCNGCGACLDTCGFDAIKIENGKAVQTAACRGCGRCATYCPLGAVHISLDNPNAVEDVKARISRYVNVKSA